MCDRSVGALAFRALIDLDAQVFESGGRRYALVPGMQVTAEVNLGTRTVLEYLVSPLRKAFHEAARDANWRGPFGHRPFFNR